MGIKPKQYTSKGTEIAFYSKTINDERMKFRFTDTPRTVHYRGHHVSILMYDITKRESLNKLETILKQVQEHGVHIEKFLLFGNKVDLKSTTEECVSMEEAQRWAGDHGIEFSVQISLLEAINDATSSSSTSSSSRSTSTAGSSSSSRIIDSLIDECLSDSEPTAEVDTTRCVVF